MKTCLQMNDNFDHKIFSSDHKFEMNFEIWGLELFQNNSRRVLVGNWTIFKKFCYVYVVNEFDSCSPTSK